MVTEKGPRRNSSPHKNNSDRWLLTYSDLITLLLAFFIMMFGLSNADAQKFATMAESMRRAFSVDVLQGNPRPGLLDQSTSLRSETTGVADGIASTQEKDLEMITQEMGWAMQQEGLSDKVSVGLRPEGTAISISGNLLFSSGRAELRPDAVKLLASFGRILSQLPNNVRIEGHTDDIPPSDGTYSSNWELSSARSVAIVRYLVEMENIDPTRLSAVAYSQYHPIAPNDSALSRGRNRRAEVLILYPSTPLSPQANKDREMNLGSITR